MEFEIEDMAAIRANSFLREKDDYTWDEIEKKYPLKWRNAVNYYVSSDLPNRYFLNQFSHSLGREKMAECEWLRPCRFWEACAFILIKRGLPRISDVKKELLVWWKDANWPGFLLIHKFVVEHGEEFLPEIKETVFTAYNRKDVIWLQWLFEYLYKEADLSLTEAQIEKIDEMIEFFYATDDGYISWETFKVKYGGFILEICR